MSKSNVVMKNWEVYYYGEKYNLSGMTDEHHELGKRVHVTRTSRLVDYKLEDDILIYETRNTIYKCPLKYMSKYPYYNVTTEYKKELVNRVNEKSNTLDRIIAVAALISLENKKERAERKGKSIEGFIKEGFIKDEFIDCELFEHITALQVDGQREIEEMENKFHDHLIAIAKKYENCIYMELSNVSRGDELAYHIEGNTGIIEPMLHVGTFQDSVLYMQYQQDEQTPGLDFRYFPKGLFLEQVETYSWSDNILNAVIKNDSTRIIHFNGEVIEIGETKSFTPEKHKQGLISPDCYNGKSLFWVGEENE